jgi:hypothetical protein
MASSADYLTALHKMLREEWWLLYLLLLYNCARVHCLYIGTLALASRNCALVMSRFAVQTAIEPR